MNEGLIPQDAVSFPLTDSNAQTGEAGWSIDNSLLWRFPDTTLWYTRPAALLIAIRGTTATTDATLSGLTLTDVDGNAVALDTTFASGDYEYEASVANSDSAVTLTATKNDSNATVDITDDDDTSTPNEAELGLRRRVKHPDGDRNGGGRQHHANLHGDGHARRRTGARVGVEEGTDDNGR